ncbi:TetR/AcrR family transcriptional regulator [Halodurantibacterium flavum]|uniref:TetR/AcrR family transcriptional regulator n=1 Tax=Halodurantibacterium flavum TaxID=1382802 RepID=A0ABW4S0M6_9RHOB
MRSPIMWIPVTLLTLRGSEYNRPIATRQTGPGQTKRSASRVGAMSGIRSDAPGERPSRRLSKAERREQLLETALMIVRDEGADRLTLGRLAARAGVSKPVAYDHFGTPAGLLIELYRAIDTKRVTAFRDAMAAQERSVGKTAISLAEAYIQCAANTTDAFHAVGAALAGSEEKAAVYQELLGQSVEMFAAVLKPHSGLDPAELHRRCIGLVGAGESLSAALVRGTCSETEAVNALASLIEGAVSGTDDA